jgi:TolB protein
MDMATLSARRLTYEGNYNTAPRWSPRGDLIAFSSMLGGKFQICVIKPDGRGYRRVTNVASNEHPTFSPDGRHIAFESNRHGKWAIYGMLANGTNVRRLTMFPGSQRMPDWSPRLGQ